MRISSNGRVTVPLYIREHLGLLPNSKIDWEVVDGAAVLRKAPIDGRALIDRMRGRASVRMTTDEIMALTRGEA